MVRIINRSGSVGRHRARPSWFLFVNALYRASLQWPNIQVNLCSAGHLGLSSGYTHYEASYQM